MLEIKRVCAIGRPEIARRVGSSRSATGVCRGEKEGHQCMREAAAKAFIAFFRNVAVMAKIFIGTHQYDVRLLLWPAGGARRMVCARLRRWLRRRSNDVATPMSPAKSGSINHREMAVHRLHVGGNDVR